MSKAYNKDSYCFITSVYKQIYIEIANLKIIKKKKGKRNIKIGGWDYCHIQQAVSNYWLSSFDVNKLPWSMYEG